MSNEVKFTPPSDAHWYDETGKPVFEVPKAKGDGMKKPNINDAIALGLYPSVTTILKTIDKPFLTAWFKNQVLDASINISSAFNRPITDEDRPLIMERADEVSAVARERGQLIHQDCEEWAWAVKLKRGYTIRGMDDSTHERFAAVMDQMRWAPRFIEHSFASPRYGYAGKTDLAGYAMNPLLAGPRRRAVADFKTQDTKGKGKFNLYPEMPLQLAAYAYGLEYFDADLYVVMISSTEPGLVEVWHYEEIDFYFYAFLDILKVYKGPAGKALDCRSMGKARRVL